MIDLEIDNLAQRHKISRQIVESMGEARPAFGMIGTVIGLIVIMANLSDPNAIGPGLAVALITTSLRSTCCEYDIRTNCCQA